MGTLNSWDVTDANNNAAPPDGWPENTMAYSDVNDTGRAVQGTLKRFFDDINGTLVGAGAADAYTVTLNESGYSAYFNGMIFKCSVVAANATATPTINVNGIGAVTIVDAGGNALDAGALETGGIYEFQYDGTNFRVGGGLAGGTFILDAQENLYGGTGAGAALTGTANDNFLAGNNAGAAITTGDDNIFIGQSAGLIADAESDNIAIGANALSKSILSDGNVAIGVNALRMFTGSASAGSNIAIGDSALGDAVGTLTAVGNIAIGDGAMSNANSLGNTTSTIAIGSNALNGLNGGGGNVAIGDSAGTGITTGISNVLIGRNAGQAITIGNNNIVIGPGGPTTAITGRIWMDFLASSDQPAIGGTLGGANSGIEFGGVVFFYERVNAQTDQAGLGQVWVRDDVPNNLMFTDDAGTDWQLTGQELTELVVKSADESVANSTTLQNDDELVVSLDANSVYAIEIGLIFSAPNNTPDFKWNVTAPASSEYFFDGNYTFDGAGLGVSRLGSTFSAADGNHTIVSTAASMATLSGFIHTEGTAGNLQIQWAQLTSDAGATTVEQFSYIRARKLT